MTNWKEIILWKETPERKKIIRRKGLIIVLITTTIGIIIDTVLYFKMGFFPEMILILFFSIGIGSYSLITGHELPDD